MTNSQFEYQVLFNNEDITNFQLERFYQKRELHILKDYNFTYDKFSVKMPFDFKQQFIKGINNNIITVNKKGSPNFIGYITDNTINIKTKFYELDSQPFLNLLSKSETLWSETEYSNGITKMANMFSAMLNKINNYYTLSPMVYSLIGDLSLNCFVNDTSPINDINLILDFCTDLNIGIYFKGTVIYFFLIPENWATDAQVIDNYVISPEPIQQATEIYFDAVSITYNTAIGGTDKTVTTGTGNIVKAITTPFFMDDSSAQTLSNRTYNIFNKDYYTLENLEINKQYIIDIGNYFKYQNFIFLCTAIDENQTTYKLSGIGIQL